VNGKLFPKRRDLKDVADELREWERTAAKSAMMVRHGAVQNVPVRFPNGNVTLFPSDMYIFFECQSLKNASPSMLSQIAIVNTQTSDVTYLSMFQQRQSNLKKSH